MRIIVVGAGVIGANLAKSLIDERHDVYLIEENEATAAKAEEKLEVKVILGSGTDPVVLRRAEASLADLVIAVTASDETNLVVCSLAAALGAKQRIARVRNTSLSQLIAEFGLEKFFVDEIINPEHVAAQSIVRTIKTPGAREVADFADGKILLRAFEVPKTSTLCGMKIEALREEDFPWPFLIIAMIRQQQVIFPKGDTVVLPEDRIYVLLPKDSLAEFLTFVNPDSRRAKKVVISGATDVGEKVAELLADEVKEIILVEENLEKANDVAGRLSNTRIINGSAAESDILKECGIEAADVFISTTGNDHSNLISAVLAKKLGAKTTIIITQRPDYMSIVDALDIDVIINPRFLAADQIMRLVRGKGIHAMTQLRECDTEVLEFIPEPGSAVTKGPLKTIHFPKEAIVGAVCRGSEVILASGDTQIKEGEKVIVFCHESAVKKLQALFTQRKFF